MALPTLRRAFGLVNFDKAGLGELAEATCLKLDLNREARTLEVSASFSRSLTYPELCGLQTKIQQAYTLRKVELTPVYAAFEDGDVPCLIDCAIKGDPICGAVLSDCGISREDGKLILRLRAPGAVFLEDAGTAREMERILRMSYSAPLKVVIIDGEESEAAPAPAEDCVCSYSWEAPVVEAAEEFIPPPPPEPEPQPAPQREFNRGGGFSKRPPRPKAPPVPEEDIYFGKNFGEVPIKMSELDSDVGEVAVCGEVFAVETKDTRSGRQRIISADMTDKTGSVRIKRIIAIENSDELLKNLVVGAYIKVRGEMEQDNFYGDRVLKFFDIVRVDKPERKDTCSEKRVELHMHTTMSQMDAVSTATSLISRAKSWGHKAIAVTDHGVTQAFPEALKAGKGIKVLYGCEAYFSTATTESFAVVGKSEEPVNGEYVCFDLETTGTDVRKERITEIGACIVRDGVRGETFHTYVDPEKPISAFITKLTGISDATVAGAPKDEEAIRAFREFCGDRPVVAHNASFDTGFVAAVCDRIGLDWKPVSVDTLELSRVLLPELQKHKLDVVASHLNAPQFRHHTAEADAAALAFIFAELMRRARDELGAETLANLNELLTAKKYKNAALGALGLPSKTYHIILLAKNRTGIVNLYRLVSIGHLKYLNRRKNPVIPRFELDKYREGLIVGSACEAGELYSAIADGKSAEEIERIASYYDFLEIQPLGNNEFMIRDGIKRGRDEIQYYTEDDLKDFNRRICRLGEKLGKPVVATGDVHFLDKEDARFRAILQASEGFKDSDNQAPLYLRTTDEMLEEFAYLGEKKAWEVVVTNTNIVADWCEDGTKPFPDGLFPPRIPGSDQELRDLTWSKARELYGDPLPEIVETAIKKEIEPIISHGYDVMYMFSQKLIKRSMENGYLVGSRGSVGSSIVAFFSGITEINALPPHYRCPKCKYSEFHPKEDLGPDMPEKDCPNCGTNMIRDGFDIPFATFLGFNADKEPDIDLNFSGEYQAKAHEHTKEIFGADKVFKVGTVSAVQDKIAYGYVKKYCEERGLHLSKAEENRLTIGCTGVKKTTGQHPGGLIVIPQDKEIYEFTPVQTPAGKEIDMVTTHVDYHSIDSNVLKFDLLGKDDPTILRYLEDNTGIKMDDVPINDEKVLSIFTSNEALGIEDDDIVGTNGALGIPEFGTGFVRNMLDDTQPKTIADLVRISGLSHGTNVWLDNADELVKSGIPLRECICCRDDIMVYLMKLGIEPLTAFKIMEKVRKKAKVEGEPKITPEWRELMTAHGVPEWYIESCNKISYLFPKAHASAYVVMALRIAWFKVYRPLEYYGSFFGIKAKAFDAEVMLAGEDAIKRKIREMESMGTKATQTEKELVRTLEIAYEFIKRGFKFLPIDLYKSEPQFFGICREEKALRMPFRTVPGLGGIAANELAEEREKGPFASIEDLSDRCSKLSDTIVKDLRKLGALDGLPESRQTTLFEF
ncbi:MAG: PolC-type DNA polymerase III [Clostridia bacterium]|nr:PolC-type DNA polymerase III [Clostridia bacterium]